MRALIIALGIASSACAQLREWKDYRTVLWMSGTVDKHKDQWPLIAQRMKELGINTGMAGRDAPPQHLIDSGFGYYVENVINKGLCLKFSSSVTNWSKFVGLDISGFAHLGAFIARVGARPAVQEALKAEGLIK